MKTAMDQVDQDYLNEVMKAGGVSEEKVVNSEVKVKESVKSFEELVDMKEKLGTGSTQVDSEVVLLYFKVRKAEIQIANC